MRHTSRALLAGLLAVVWSLASPSSASASLLSPEAEDKVAGFVTIFVLFVVPVVLITLFWMVHVLPEKIAHKRHHPQLEGIRTLCFLSLAFGGLLWPLAWLWAYTKPVGYKLAYGTDKHPDYFKEHPEEPAVESSCCARSSRPGRREHSRSAGAAGRAGRSGGGAESAPRGSRRPRGACRGCG